MLRTEVQLATAVDAPSSELIARWAQAAYAAGGGGGALQLTVRIVDEAEGRALNRHYRDRDRPTNVLSFPFDALPGAPRRLLGDVVICAPVVAREAGEQGKPLQAHWAHLVIHGVLHLCGHDHQQEEQARAMESVETQVLKQAGFADPYTADYG